MCDSAATLMMMLMNNGNNEEENLDDNLNANIDEPSRQSL